MVTDTPLERVCADPVIATPVPTAVLPVEPFPHVNVVAPASITIQ